MKITLKHKYLIEHFPSTFKDLTLVQIIDTSKNTFEVSYLDLPLNTNNNKYLIFYQGFKTSKRRLYYLI